MGCLEPSQQNKAKRWLRPHRRHELPTIPCSHKTFQGWLSPPLFLASSSAPEYLNCSEKKQKQLQNNLLHPIVLKTNELIHSWQASVSPHCIAQMELKGQNHTRWQTSRQLLFGEMNAIQNTRSAQPQHECSNSSSRHSPRPKPQPWDPLDRMSKNNSN